MTRKLMSLAEGKVVLVLEGGYELNALAECGKLCIEALLNRQVGSIRCEDLIQLFDLNRFQNFLKKLSMLNQIVMPFKVSKKSSKFNVCSIRIDFIDSVFFLLGEFWPIIEQYKHLVSLSHSKSTS